jgi:hypothetical protein
VLGFRCESIYQFLVFDCLKSKRKPIAIDQSLISNFSSIKNKYLSKYLTFSFIGINIVEHFTYL